MAAALPSCPNMSMRARVAKNKIQSAADQVIKESKNNFLANAFYDQYRSNIFCKKVEDRLFKTSKIKITFGQESRIERKLPPGKVMAFGKLLNRAWHWKGSHYCSRPFHILTKSAVQFFKQVAQDMGLFQHDRYLLFTQNRSSARRQGKSYIPSSRKFLHSVKFSPTYF